MKPLQLFSPLWLCLCLLSMSPESRSQPAAGTGTATFKVSTNNTPLDRRALEAVGQKAFERLGMKLEVVSLPSQRSLVAANAGEVDGEGLRIAGIEEQFPNLLRVPEKITTIQFVAFGRNPDIRLDKGWDSLRALRVAHVTGWKLYESQANVARAIHKVDRPEQLFQMLAADRVDLALYTQADGERLIRNLGLTGLTALQPALREADMFLYVHQRHAGLVPRIAQALRDMKADGSFQRLATAAPAAD